MENIPFVSQKENVEELGGDSMKEKHLTEEQENKLKQLNKKWVLRSVFDALKFGATIFLANMVIFFVDVLFVQNQSFMFICSLISSFMIFRSFRLDSEKERVKFEEERKKILEQ